MIPAAADKQRGTNWSMQRSICSSLAYLTAKGGIKVEVRSLMLTSLASEEEQLCGQLRIIVTYFVVSNGSDKRIVLKLAPLMYHVTTLDGRSWPCCGGTHRGFGR